MKIKSVSIYKIPETGLLRVYYNMRDGSCEIGRVQMTVRLNFSLMEISPYKEQISDSKFLMFPGDEYKHSTEDNS